LSRVSCAVFYLLIGRNFKALLGVDIQIETLVAFETNAYIIYVLAVWLFAFDITVLAGLVLTY